MRVGGDRNSTHTLGFVGSHGIWEESGSRKHILLDVTAERSLLLLFPAVLTTGSLVSRTSSPERQVMPPATLLQAACQPSSFTRPGSQLLHGGEI